MLSEVLESKSTYTLFVDNASALNLAKNTDYHRKSEHIEIHHVFLSEKFLDGDLELNNTIHTTIYTMYP